MENGKAIELTELERTKLENFALKHNALQQQSQANLQARAAFIQEIEAAHPGYRWDDQKGLIATAIPPKPVLVDEKPGRGKISRTQ